MEVKEAFPEYSKPSLAVDAVIMRVCDFSKGTNKTLPAKKMQVLLIKDKSEDKWHLPGTMIHLGETPKQALSRILETKTQLNDVYFEQLYTVADDPLRDERGHIITMVYIGLITDNEEINIQNNSSYESRWFWVTKPQDNEQGEKKRHFVTENWLHSENDLMYDHADIINDTITRIQGKLMYSEIGFKLVPNEFTISQLEDTFNAIMEKSIAGFRRIIANKIQETGKIETGKSYRPAKIYKRKDTKERG